MPKTKKIQEPGWLAVYRKAYPLSKEFYVTSDNLVFLQDEYQKAVSHQSTLMHGELSTY